jgi:hypothetical protein
MNFRFMPSYLVGDLYVCTYKHIQTNRYLNINHSGQCYGYDSPNASYKPITDEAAFNHVYG